MLVTKIWDIQKKNRRKLSFPHMNIMSSPASPPHSSAPQQQGQDRSSRTGQTGPGQTSTAARTTTSPPVYATLAHDEEEDPDYIQTLSGSLVVEDNSEDSGAVNDALQPDEVPLGTSTPTPKVLPFLVEKYNIVTPSVEETRTSSSPLFHQQYSAHE